MRIPTTDDFRAIEEWGLIEYPLAAIADYSPERDSKRADNDRHQRAKREYENAQSEAFIEDTQAYYRAMDRPIDRTKWTYLKHRKAWFQPPLEWGQFASPGTSRILDLGCGDGDQTQRVAEFVAGRWQSTGYDGFPLEIVGIDLNDSRIENARRHTKSPHEKITLRFEQGDSCAGLDYESDFFDYTLAMGLLEVLDDDRIEQVLEEITRLTTHGVYVRDLLEEYPGLSPRPNLADRFSNRGFECIEREKLFEEPFTASGTMDPLEIWPMNVHQVLFLTNENPVDRSERY